MSIITFKQDGYTVVTAAWSASSKDGKTVELCYTWASGSIGFLDSSTGVERCTLNITMRDFLKRINSGASSVFTDFTNVKVD
jgi:hypothetical protein